MTSWQHRAWLYWPFGGYRVHLPPR